jgi:hypothetical protein
MLLRAAARFLALALLTTPALSAAPEPTGEHWQTVLVAGDIAQPVFDNATRAVDLWLTEHKVAPADIHRLSASAGRRNRGTEPATLERVLHRIASLHAGPGDRCMVFITSHGAPEKGVYLARNDEMLSPEALAQALSAGCGTAPTVVVISACYSGSFARAPMTAPNRIVLTAARADRPSFGCAAERTYTVYDACLIGALPHATTWRGAYGEIKNCVERHEQELKETPSHPQASFGNTVLNLPLRFSER